MAQTDLFRFLSCRNNALKKALLPIHLSPTGNYKEKKKKKVRAYEVLVHAELEYYFEQLAIRIMQNAWDEWNNNIATKAIVALVAYSEKSFAPLPESTSDQRRNEDLKKRVHDAYTEHNRYIRSLNHGIKEKNILALFLPLGIEIGTIDNNLLIALDSFGSNRGQIAHSTRAVQNVTPEDAMNTVAQILALVALFDSYVLNEYSL